MPIILAAVILGIAFIIRRFMDSDEHAMSKAIAERNRRRPKP